MECVDLSVIPQFGGTCWFNAILTIALYSQYVRKIMINNSKNWSKSNSFLMVLKAVLLKYYNQPDKVQEFFNKIKPELILFKMIKTFNDKALLNFFKNSIKQGQGLGFDPEFIVRFFKYIGIKTLDIVVAKKKGWIYSNYNYYLNTDNEYSMVYNKQYGTISYYLKNIEPYLDKGKVKAKKEEIFNETSKIIEDVPDILIVKHEELLEISKYKHFFQYHYLEEFNSSKYDFEVSGLDTYNDYIVLNGHTYKLDAVILGNYDSDIHAIAGITCNFNRYVYNGWNSQSVDPALQSSLFEPELTKPCSLMKYNWDLRKTEDFCLNPKTCKLDFIKDKRNLCFSFGKGNRILIYARTNSNIRSNITSRNSVISNINLSGMSSIIKDIYDFKNLSDDEIIDNLKRDFNINLPPIVKANRAALERYYYNVLSKHYNIQKAGKRELKSKKK